MTQEPTSLREIEPLMAPASSFVVSAIVTPFLLFSQAYMAADAASSIEATFTEQLAHHTHDDGSVIAVPDGPAIHRFVRARKGDVSAAVLQYANTARWRRAERVDSITEPDLEEPIYQAICPHRNHGLVMACGPNQLLITQQTRCRYDKQGRPVYIELTGRIKVPKLLEYLTPEKLVRRHVRQQEIATARMKKQSEKLGRLIETQICILDLTDLSMVPNKTAMQIFKETIDIDQVAIYLKYQ